MHHFHMKMSLFGLCTSFSKVTLFSLREVFLWTSNMPKMRWRPGLRPGPRQGNSRCFPRPLLGWVSYTPCVICCFLTSILVCCLVASSFLAVLSFLPCLATVADLAVPVSPLVSGVTVVLKFMKFQNCPEITDCPEILGIW